MRRWRITVGLVAVILIAGGFLGWHTMRKPRAALPLTVLFSCDTQGRLEPCGCFTGQYGGMTRIHTHMQEMSSDHMLRVDVGDAMPGTEDYRQIQYQFVLKAFAAMQYDALNLGHREIRLSAGELAELRKGGTPLVSANVMEAERGELIFPGYRLVERGGYTIAIVGVVDPRGTRDIMGSGLRIAPMQLAIANLLPAIADADMRVLLAFTDVESLRSLAREFFEFDLVLGGKVAQPSQEVTRENRGVILYTTNEARTLGVVRGEVRPDAGFAMADWDIHLLHDNIAEAPEILAIIDSYRQDIANRPLAIDRLQATEGQVPGVANQATYVGTEACIACHEDAAEIWSKTRHAQAFEALRKRESASDPQCIGCHTIGFGKPSGYRRSMAGAELVNVGCESCHGPGSEHVQQRTAGDGALFRFRPLGAGDCKRCHYGEFSRPFAWDDFWPSVAH